MHNTNDLLSTLTHELEFLDRGGYQMPTLWRQPLFCMETSVDSRQPEFFEDSPICPKKHYAACSVVSDCVLKEFVPIKYQRDPVPCHQIPLNEKGDTLQKLFRTDTRERAEEVMREWLVRNIERLRIQPAIPQTAERF